MNSVGDQALALVGGTGIGFGLAALGALCRRKLWVKKAHQLAVKSDIALPDAVLPRVIGLLRRRYLVGVAVTIPASVLLAMVLGLGSWAQRGQHYWSGVFPWVIVFLPLLIIGCGLAISGPHRTSHGGLRIAHPGRLSPWRAFTRTELVTLLAGVLATVGAASWGLWRLDALGWLPVWVVVMAASVGAWWRAAVALMNRPARGGDVLALGWDDVFRFMDLRGLTIVAAWGPAAFILLFDDQVAFQLGSEQSVSFLPGYLMIAVGAGLAVIFRQGRRRWRLAWTAPAIP